MMEILEKVERLKAELDALRPLDPVVEAKIWQKFRLDWNYHSNKLEGNTYSYGETKMLLLKGLTAGGKPIRDHEEITGHDEAINFILDSIKNDEPLSEIFIRHLHQLILVRSYWADAKTADGQPTKRLIKAGEYKTEPNHVETQTGEIFYFAEPIETPAKMQELVEWFRNKIESAETNAILLAAEFHYRFVRIHPFDDGNGRMARLLMNFILMKYSYPPVIVKNEDKDNYISVLEQADFNILEPFIEYVASNLASSLGLVIKGTKGEDIEEPEDFEKELVLLERRLQKPDEGLLRSKQTSSDVLRSLMPQLLRRFLDMARKFDRFYAESNLKVQYVLETSPAKTRSDMVFNQSLSTLDNSQFTSKPQVLTELALRKLAKISLSELICLEISYTHELFKSDKKTSYQTRVSIKFQEINYGIVYGENEDNLFKPYSEPIVESEITAFIRELGNQHKAWIEQQLENPSQSSIQHP